MRSLGQCDWWQWKLPCRSCIGHLCSGTTESAIFTGWVRALYPSCERVESYYFSELQLLVDRLPHAMKAVAWCTITLLQIGFHMTVRELRMQRLWVCFPAVVPLNRVFTQSCFSENNQLYKWMVCNLYKLLWRIAFGKRQHANANENR